MGYGAFEQSRALAARAELEKCGLLLSDPHKSSPVPAPVGVPRRPVGQVECELSNVDLGQSKASDGC